MKALEISFLLTDDLLRLSSQLLARDVRRRFGVNSVVAFHAVCIARERAMRGRA